MRRVLVLVVLLLVCPAAARAQSSIASSFGSIFTQLPGDFARLATPGSAIALGSTSLGALALYPKDDAIAAWGNDADQIFSAGGVLGDGTTHAAAGLALFILGHAMHAPRTTDVGIDLLRAQIVSGTITDLLKAGVDRRRPDGHKYSFPSGHSSSAFATAVILQDHYGWRAALPAYLVAAYIGGSRVANFRHYATDVLVGAGIGIAAGHAVALHRGETRITLAPSVSPGAASLTVVITTP